MSNTLIKSIQQAITAAELQLKKVGIESARLDSEVLLAHVLSCERSYLYIHPEIYLSLEQEQTFQKLIIARYQHQPIAYLTGHKEFMGLDFLVTPAVLIPRPETEILVETVINLISDMQTKQPKRMWRILDIGTGSGNVAVVLTKHISESEIVAVDISAAAIAVAKQNAIQHQVSGQINFIVSDLFSNLRKEKASFDIIISNPPYIADEDYSRLSRDIQDYEPKLALNGGVQGLEIIQRIISESPQYLKKPAYLCLEIGDGQGKAVQELINRSNEFNSTATQLRFDLAGKERMVITQIV